LEAHAAGDINNGYVVSNQETLGITKAFDDGQNTIVAFADIETLKPAITDAAGKTLHYQRVGDYAVLPGLYRDLRVAEGKTRGTIKAAVLQSSPAVAEAPLPVAVPSPATAAVSPVVPSTAGLAVQATSSQPSYKAGAAIYPIPYATPKAASAPSSAGMPASTSSSAHASVTALAIAPVAPAPPPPKPTWTLRQGYPIGQELKSWAKQAEPHWTVVWNMSSDVVAPSTTTFSGDFATAAQQVITDLAANGALIHYKTFDGNNTLVVFGPGATAQ
jgi:hypothetical protein